MKVNKMKSWKEVRDYITGNYEISDYDARIYTDTFCSVNFLQLIRRNYVMTTGHYPALFLEF